MVDIAGIGALAQGGGSILSALLGAGEAQDFEDLQRDVFDRNFELQERRLEQDELFNELVRRLATASTENIRGDRTFFDERTGTFRVEPSDFTSRVSSLLDAATQRQAEAAGPIQARALRARERTQPEEIAEAEELLSVIRNRDPLSATDFRNTTNLQTSRGINRSFDRAIESVLGRLGGSSNVGRVLEDINRQRADLISDRRIGLPQARAGASQLDAAEMSNLLQQYNTLIGAGTQQLPLPSNPSDPLLATLVNRANVAPQTLGISRVPIVPQQALPSGPNFGDALAVGSIGDAISGTLGNLQANDQVNRLLEALANRQSNVFVDARQPNSGQF